MLYCLCSIRRPTQTLVCGFRWSAVTNSFLQFCQNSLMEMQIEVIHRNTLRVMCSSECQHVCIWCKTGWSGGKPGWTDSTERSFVLHKYHRVISRSLHEDESFLSCSDDLYWCCWIRTSIYISWLQVFPLYLLHYELREPLWEAMEMKEKRLLI